MYTNAPERTLTCVLVTALQKLGFTFIAFKSVVESVITTIAPSALVHVLSVNVYLLADPCESSNVKPDAVKEDA